jgi:nickel transport protein
MIRTDVLPALLAGATAVLSSVLLPGAVRAHGIQSSLERISGLTGSSASERLEIQSQFSSGVPARDATVRLLPTSGGEPIELGHTGPDGRLRFTLPAIARAGGEIQVDAGPGHRDYLELSDIEPLPGRAGSATHSHSLAPRGPWPWQVTTALIGLGLVGGAGLFRRQRRNG